MLVARRWVSDRSWVHGFGRLKCPIWFRDLLTNVRSYPILRLKINNKDGTITSLLPLIRTIHDLSYLSTFQSASPLFQLLIPAPATSCGRMLCPLMNSRRSQPNSLATRPSSLRLTVPNSCPPVMPTQSESRSLFALSIALVMSTAGFITARLFIF
jgi:hypothetical protein